MKKCSSCQLLKDESEFCKDKSRKDGLNHRCKSCVKQIQSNNRDKILEYGRQYYQDHKEEHFERCANWRNENRELIRERFRTRYRQTQTQYILRRREEDPLFRLHCGFSANLRMSLKTIGENGISKNEKHWELIVGYTLEDLAIHLEELFHPGMSWENYGSWHVDHIIPVSAFKIKELGDEEFLKCWNLSNLQPLWALDNIRKSNRIGEEWGNLQS